MTSRNLSVVGFTPLHADHFKSINEEWIREMFVLESKDQKVLNSPESEIIQGGGVILFVEAEGLGIVGTGALLKTGDGEYELTKMGVLKAARGLKAGEFLLQALIQKAQSLNASLLYLLTNKKCEAAIHLYKKNGFFHDHEIMKRFGGEYQRCDVAMKFDHL